MALLVTGREMKMYEKNINTSGGVHLGKERLRTSGVTPRNGAPVTVVIWKGDEFVDFTKEVTSNYSVYIPKEKRDLLGVEEGDKIGVIVQPDTAQAGLDALYA